MQLKTLLLAGFMATVAMARSAPTKEHRNVLDDGLQQETTSRVGKRDAVIPTYVHVLYDGSITDEESGDVPDSMIEDQHEALNNAFSDIGFKFELQRTERTDNKAWSNGDNESDMKASLHEGDASTLNIYVVSNLGGKTGDTKRPEDYDSNPVMDGCSILYTTMPGGSNPSYKEGITLVHEVGHWLGLYDTFEGGCTAPGDYVDDTPFQATASVGCPIGINTCPQEGDDPVHNYMDTSDDTCRNNFTPGQAERMAQIAKQYRGINL
ncbi:hypothetical protein V500_04645 [Pseudogymnoascus sp. VKM F-4518 (FW-2643)]|nr:hypothetical protein V500_04645 [Pseudogymnoascus sp. VKM F-4518 (FW-2643)]